MLEASPAVCRVVIRISSIYWLVREVLRDSLDVVIVPQENVRLLTQEKLKLLRQRYNLEILSENFVDTGCQGVRVSFPLYPSQMLNFAVHSFLLKGISTKTSRDISAP